MTSEFRLRSAIKDLLSAARRAEGVTVRAHFLCRNSSEARQLRLILFHFCSRYVAVSPVSLGACVREFIELIFFLFLYKKYLIASRAIFLDSSAKKERSFIIAKIVTKRSVPAGLFEI